MVRLARPTNGYEPLPLDEALLEKPFTMATLVATVNRILGQGL